MVWAILLPQPTWLKTNIHFVVNSFKTYMNFVMISHIWVHETQEFTWGSRIPRGNLICNRLLNRTDCSPVVKLVGELFMQIIFRRRVSSVSSAIACLNAPSYRILLTFLIKTKLQKQSSSSSNSFRLLSYFSCFINRGTQSECFHDTTFLKSFQSLEKRRLIRKLLKFN